MPIIEARSQEARKAVTVRLSEGVLGLVDEYAAVLSEERGYVGRAIDPLCAQTGPRVFRGARARAGEARSHAGAQ